MDYKATLMVLVLVSSTLAGCTGDPDGGGGDEIDSDALQDLFDEHFQDFLNNTTITVINNYHNNTTHMVDDGDYSTTTTTNIEYNNTTNVDGEEVNNYYEENDYSSSNYSLGGNGTGSGYIIYTVDRTFTLNELWFDETAEEIDHLNNSIDYSYNYYDYMTNQNRTDVFTIQCSVYYIVGSAGGNNSSWPNSVVTYWEDNDYYDDAWTDLGYNSTIRDMFQEAAWNQSVRLACDEGYPEPTGGYHNEVIFSFTVPEGYAFRCIGPNSDNPILFYRNTVSNESTNWNQDSSYTYASMYLDNLRHYCGWELLVGGSEDITFEIRYDLHHSFQYRVFFAYQLVPVVAINTE